MAVDPLADLVGRADHLLKRIERLETLEYGTVAFPTGTGLICDIVVTVPVASVTCTPIVAAAFRHILAIVAAGVTANPASGKMRVTIGGSPASYEFATRQESHTLPGGVGIGPATFVDTESASAVSLAFWDTVHPAAHETAVIDEDKQGAAFYLFPEPGLSSPAFLLGPFAIWMGYAMKDGPALPASDTFLTLDQGGGGNYSSPVPFTSITWAATPPDLFAIGSRFTVYGLA